MWRDPRWLAVASAIALAACGDPRLMGPGDGSDGGGGDAADDFIEQRFPGEPGRPRVLVYTFENIWHHYSMIELRAVIINMAASRGFNVVTTNHPLAINAANLADIDVVVFAVTSGSGLTPSGKADLEAWIRKGGGVVGFHSATYTEPLWPFYVANIGTGFAGHANGLWPATVKMQSTTHPITEGLPDLQITDEWYYFSQRPETIPGATMLLELDEDSLPADFPAVNKQGYHAIGWANHRFGGRMFYSGIGHNPATFGDPTVLEIVGRAIEWAAHHR